MVINLQYTYTFVNLFPFGVRDKLGRRKFLRWFRQRQKITSCIIVYRNYLVLVTEKSIVMVFYFSRKLSEFKSSGATELHRSMYIRRPSLIPSTRLLIRSFVFRRTATAHGDGEVRPTPTPPQPSGYLIYDQRSTGWSAGQQMRTS